MSNAGFTAESAETRTGRAQPRFLSLRSALSAISAVNPASLLFGPIFQKEVRTSGRKKGGYIGRALYALALLGVVGVVFWGLWQNLARQSSTVQRIQQMQEMAPALALTIIWFQFVMLALMGPNLTSPAIADEKRTGTLSALLTTPMTSGQIVGGKLAGRLVHVLILSLLAVPLLLAVRLFGGLDASLILQATAISLSTAILGAALGLLFSVWNKRSTNAAVFGLLTLALFQSAIPAIDGMMYLWLEDRGYKFHEQTLAACSPAALAELTISVVRGFPPPEVSITLTEPTATTSGWTLNLGPLWLVSTLYTLFLALLVSFIASVALRRTMLREASKGGDAGAAMSRPTGIRRKRAPTAMPAAPPTEAGEVPAILVDPGEPQEVLGRDRTVGDNPVLWREIRQPTFGSRRRFFIVLGVAVLGLSFLYWKFGLREDDGLHGSIAVVGAIAVMLQSIFMTTGGFVGEREGRTWDVLLTTPLTGGEIALGKLAGSLRSQWFLPTIALAHITLCTALGIIHPILLLQLVLVFAGPFLLFSATGLFLSLWFRKSTPASVGNLILALLFWLIPWLALALLSFVFESGGSTFRPDFQNFRESASDVLYAFNPVTMAVSAFQLALEGGIHHTVLSMRYDLASTENLSPATFTLIAAGVLIADATLAGAIFWLTIACFKRRSGRSS